MSVRERTHRKQAARYEYERVFRRSKKTPISGKEIGAFSLYHCSLAFLAIGPQ